MGFLFKGQEAALMSRCLERVLTLVAPSVLAFGEHPSGQLTEALNPALVQLIEQLVHNASSKAAGVLGSLVLLAICIQVLACVEEALNDFWQIVDGRPWVRRCLVYSALIGCSFAGLAAALVLRSGSSAKGTVAPALAPFSLSSLSGLSGLSYSSYSRALGFGGTWVLFCLFYKILPYTPVRWLAVMPGAAFATLCFALTHRLSALYIHKALEAQSTYGAVGIIPVLMFGLYIFWAVFLIGGQGVALLDQHLRTHPWPSKPYTAPTASGAGQP
jgi:membrane protein